MKALTTQDIRNVAVLSHMGAGKTSLVESLLFLTGVTSRLGRVEDGNTLSDSDPEEVRRHSSIAATPLYFYWREHKLNLLDTPGFLDFMGEVKSAIRVADAALLLVSSIAGVEVGTELYWRALEERGIPRAFLVTKLDKENAVFAGTLQQLEENFGKSVTPMQLPIGKEAGFKGVVDLLRMKALLFQDGSGKVEEGEIPAEMAEEAAAYRERLMEAATEGEDALLEKYLEEGELTREEVQRGLGAAIKAGKVFPVLITAAVHNLGCVPLLDFLVDFFPNPAEVDPVLGSNPKNGEPASRLPLMNQPFSAFIWKTMTDPYVGKISLLRVYSGALRPDSRVWNANREMEEKVATPFFQRGKGQENATEIIAGDLGAVSKLSETKTGDTLTDREHPILLVPTVFPKPVISVALLPKSKGDEDKISTALARMMEEDPTLAVRRDAEIGQTILSGLGQAHLEATLERMKRKFAVDVEMQEPRVPYRETIRVKVNAEGKHKKQTGGHGQFGHCYIEFSPLERGKGFEFENRTVGGSIPKQYIPAVEKGLREALVRGLLAGFPMVDFKAAVYDGSFHPVDSSEMAFKIAASLAYKKGIVEAKPVLLEPIMQVEVLVGEAYMGEIISDLNSKRGRILGMDSTGHTQVIKALVPMAEMLTYANDLTSITQGRGYYKMEFSSYEEVPSQIAEGIIEGANAEREQEKE
ncbi:MAG: elongation factor G [Coprothermobacterota bacterium]|nr:elongation factor G [Coprothermobacterota bacterium]